MLTMEFLSIKFQIYAQEYEQQKVILFDDFFLIFKRFFLFKQHKYENKANGSVITRFELMISL